MVKERYNRHYVNDNDFAKLCFMHVAGLPTLKSDT